MEDNPSIECLKRELWNLCHRTSAITAGYVDTVLTKKAGLTYQQFLVLAILEHKGNQGTVGNIAEELGRTQNTLSVIIDRMEKNGLVIKTRNMSDRRLVKVVMTDKGKQKFAETAKIGWGLVAEFISPFSEEETKLMVQLIGRLEKSTREKIAAWRMAEKINKTRY
jgi:DNA-binding MarR family transcriptional regulator